MTGGQSTLRAAGALAYAAAVLLLTSPPQAAHAFSWAPPACGAASRSPAAVRSRRAPYAPRASAPHPSPATFGAAPGGCARLRHPAGPALRASKDGRKSSSSSSSSNRGDGLMEDTAAALRRTAWMSWWTQVVLSTVSAVILLFARSVGGYSSSKVSSPPSFFVGGVGIALSVTSIFWTWGGARLASRLRRGRTSRVQAANLLRRSVTFGTALNLAGMLVTLLGLFAIIGGLATKVLTGGGLMPFGAMAGGGGGGAASIVAQTVQPLDILVVQANANTLLSHFSSLVFSLYLTRYVRRLDPPSTED